MQADRNPCAADIVTSVYLIGASIILATQWNSGADYRTAVTQNLLLCVVLWGTWYWVGRADSGGQRRYPEVLHAIRVIRMFYPLVFIGLAYVQIGLFARMIFGPDFTFDPMVERWDAVFFGLSPHMWFHRVLPGRFWAELMHFLYVLYFPLLGGSFLFVIAKRRSDYERFAFVFLASFLSFVAVFIAFPVTGPLEYREGLFPDTVVFSNLVDYLFSFGIPDPGGAFPSSHVGQSVVVLLLLRPLSRPMYGLVVFVIVGIGVSMGFASVHYQIDALAGVPAGIGLYYLWNSVYLRWIRPPQ
ncbi:MAG: hypothetical protein EA383_00400 [Spirochaetaceae bacterium]|nr:MAG: hypothetical protein EA383_00400 [Spirochaetaceae bacterium]